MATNLILLNGPNLNLLGTREPEVYGATTLAEIEDQSRRVAEAAGARLICFQSNHEGALIDIIHSAKAVGSTPSLLIRRASLTLVWRYGMHWLESIYP
jgi:3-dehydroquinate dehydratase-2